MGRRKEAKRTSKQPTAVAKPWIAMKVADSTGALPGESVGEALRRQVAWIALGVRWLDEYEPPIDMIEKTLREAAQTIMTLTLEVDELERADEHNQKLVSAP